MAEDVFEFLRNFLSPSCLKIPRASIHSMFIQDDEGNILVEDVSTTIDMKGSDVLNSLRDLATNSDVILDPLPDWVTKAVYRGRNHIKIKPRLINPKKNARKMDLDEISISGSDM